MANLRGQPDSDDDVQEIAPRRMSKKRKSAAPEIVKVESDNERQFLSNSDEDSSSDNDAEKVRVIRKGHQQRGRSDKEKPSLSTRRSRKRLG
jgi:hypothetical protein